MLTQATTPTAVSKKYAGGFGGVGSVYTQSHITHTRKHSQYRMQQNTGLPQNNIQWPMSITADAKAKLASQAALNSRGAPN